MLFDLLVAVTGREDCTSWEVSNKYYEATLEFEVCSLETDMVENYQAVIILHDFYQVGGAVQSAGMGPSVVVPLIFFLPVAW